MSGHPSPISPPAIREVHGILAQISARPDDNLTPFFLTLIAFIALVLAGFVIVVIVKRSADKHAAADDLNEASLSLSEQLRRMHARGELSDEEYARAKQHMAARAAGKDPETARRLAENAARAAAGLLVAEPGKDLSGQPLPNFDNTGKHGPQRGPEGQDPDPPNK